MPLYLNSYDLANKRHYKIVDFKTPLKAFAVPCGDSFSIAMDYSQLETTAEREVVLLHELGHCETGAFYCPSSNCINVKRCEAKADRWAVEFKAPLDELYNAMDCGYTDIWSLSELFGITEEFMRTAINYYTVNKGINFNEGYDE